MKFSRGTLRQWELQCSAEADKCSERWCCEGRETCWMWFNLLFSLTRFFDLPFSLCGCRATVIEHWVTEDSAHDSWLRSSKSSVWQSCFQSSNCCSAMAVFQKGVLVTTNHFTSTVAFLPRFQHYFLLIWIRQKNKGNILIHEKVMYSYAFWGTSEYFAFVRGMFPNTLLKWQLVGYSFRGEWNFLFQSEFGTCATSKSYGMEPLHIIF